MAHNLGVAKLETGQPEDHPLAAPGPAEDDETGEFLLVGIEIRHGRSPRALLAREAIWGLDYFGSAELDLTDTDAERFWREVDRLRSDYPHVKAQSRNARWLKPLLVVEFISAQKCRPAPDGEANG